MFPDAGLAVGLPLLAVFIAWPAAAAWRRRRLSREASTLAGSLADFAAAVRRQGKALPLDDALRAAMLRLRIEEFAALQLALELSSADAAVVADTAQRLALRLRRRVAFQRKMLARTAAGLRRGAVAAALPPIVVWLLQLGEMPLPGAALLALLLVEGLGCLLLWRLAQVEVR